MLSSVEKDLLHCICQVVPASARAYPLSPLLFQVPFDKLTDCDIEEPAGADGPVCCMVNRTLHKARGRKAASVWGFFRVVRGLSSVL